jgi:hypothetical protein
MSEAQKYMESVAVTKKPGAHLSTLESVTERQPDKVADQISDAILDAVIARDANAKFDIETLIVKSISDWSEPGKVLELKNALLSS